MALAIRILPNYRSGVVVKKEYELGIDFELKSVYSGYTLYCEYWLVLEKI